MKTFKPLNYLREDLNRYFVLIPEKERTTLCKLRVIIFNEVIWTLISYRMGQWVRLKVNNRVVKPILKAATLIIHNILRIITKIDIPFDAEIGKGLYIGHCGYIVINNKVKIADCCNISPGVIIGEGGRGEKMGVPVIGEKVYIAAGAKIFGNIIIGNNVAVGANSVVCNDVPDNAVVAGVPAKILNYDGSYDFVITK